MSSEDKERPSAPPPSSRTGKGERRVRRKRKRRPAAPTTPARRATRVALLVVLAMAAVLAIGLLVVYPNGHAKGDGRAVVFEVPENPSASDVAARLEAAGLVDSQKTFLLYVRASRQAACIAPGTHLLPTGLTPSELVLRLCRSVRVAHAKVTFPEGYTRFDMANRLEKNEVCGAAAFRRATEDVELIRELHLRGDSVEGFLFPATYDLPKDADPREIVRRLVTEFEKRYSAVTKNHPEGAILLERDLGWGPREIVTMASLVEKETGADDERPLVASVFLNRLRDPSFKRHVLQCDPTAGYGCLAMGDRIPACAGYTGKITHDINFDPQNAYSTYLREGLPPGPIANPGVKALAAVLAPAQTKYFYFVARGDGHHTFSETLEAHNAAVHGGRH